jgi:hypothetical protein
MFPSSSMHYMRLNHIIANTLLKICLMCAQLVISFCIRLHHIPSLLKHWDWRIHRTVDVYVTTSTIVSTYTNHQVIYLVKDLSVNVRIFCKQYCVCVLCITASVLYHAYINKTHLHRCGIVKLNLLTTSTGLYPYVCRQRKKLSTIYNILTRNRYIATSCRDVMHTRTCSH